MRVLTLLFALCGALCVAVAARAGEYYKWTDASGVVHYSQTPPPAGRVAKIVRVDDDTSVQPAAGVNWQAQTPQQQEQARANLSALQKTDKQVANENCALARKNAARLQGGKPLARSDAADVRLLTPEQRSQALVDVRAQIARYCSQQSTVTP